MNLLKGLNNRQLEAVEHFDSPLLVLAGAGSGKTKVLTTKIAYAVLEKNVSEYEILAITFTNKAGKEMKERIENIFKRDISNMWIGTFHSICSKILRFNIEKIGYSNNFTIYDRDDQKLVLKEIFKQNPTWENVLGEFKGAIIGLISDAKGKNVKPNEFSKYFSFGNNTDVIEKIYKKYEEILVKNNALDFDDLIFKTIELFKSCHEVLEYYSEKFKYIYVDEYQDTNDAQYEIIKLLASKYKNVCAVGDIDQSIYGWRGANISNILNFENDFENSKIILLEENYRSTQKILDCANELIKNNVNRKEKNLWTKKEGGDEIIYKSYQNENYEAIEVAQNISKLIMDGYDFSEIAVLYRANFQSFAIENALRKNSIPYRMVGGLKFYDRKEIKDILAYLKLIANPKDDNAFRRIINYPKRAIGNVSLQKLEEFCYAEKISLFDGLFRNEFLDSISKKLRDSFESFRDMIFGFITCVEDTDVEILTKELLNSIEFVNYLRENEKKEFEKKSENINLFLEEISNNYKNVKLLEYLETNSLLSDIDKVEEDDGVVTLTTIHSAKGLEYKVVFIIGMNEGIFPSERSIKERDDGLEEERRLFYVAITRAKEKLYISSTKSMTMYGKLNLYRTSGFVDEIINFVDDKSINVEFSFDDERVSTSKIRNDAYGDYSRTYVSNADIGRTKLDKPLNQYAKNKENVAKDIYKVGEKIKHEKYGVGTVIKCEKAGTKVMLMVAFDGEGIKLFDLKKDKRIKRV